MIAWLSTACEPSLKSQSGSITIDGAEFRPATCHVLVGAAGGIVLSDASGARLELRLPPAPLDAFKEIQGMPTVSYEAPGKPAIAVGPCGKMALLGESYHAQSKRAVSGRVTLGCSGAATVKGDLTFGGCF